MRLVSLVFLALAHSVAAQFGGLFDQMFGGSGGGGGGQQQHGQHHQHQQAQNVPSDSSIYRAQYARSHCDKYLCPDTLGACTPSGRRIETPKSDTGLWVDSLRSLPSPLPLRMAVSRG